MGKHLVGKGKGITFAIPNDEVEERSRGVEFFGGIKIFENNGTKVADGLSY